MNWNSASRHRHRVIKPRVRSFRITQPARCRNCTRTVKGWLTKGNPRHIAAARALHGRSAGMRECTTFVSCGVDHVSQAAGCCARIYKGVFSSERSSDVVSGTTPLSSPNLASASGGDDASFRPAPMRFATLWRCSSTPRPDTRTGENRSTTGRRAAVHGRASPVRSLRQRVLVLEFESLSSSVLRFLVREVSCNGFHRQLS